MNNRWQPTIKLSIAMGLTVLVVYHACSYMGGLIIQRMKEKKDVALTGRVDFMRRKNPMPSQREELIKAAGALEVRRDPFMLEKVVVEEAPVPEGPLMLQGIMREDNGHLKAMINGEVLEIGSFIDHFMVVEIQPEHVILIDNDPSVPEDERTIQLLLNP